MKFENDAEPIWLRIYRRNQFATEWALRHLHVRIPRKYGDEDRAYVAYLLHKSRPISATLEIDAQRVQRWTLR